jgi:tetratricopeptide (TPR) repeat protein
VDAVRKPRFYIIQYMSFTAIAAIVFAFIFGRPSENALLLFGVLFLIGLLPVYLRLIPNSVESVLLKLPEDPDEQIAALEGVLRRRAIFRRPGPRRSARLRLMHVYKDRKRFEDAISMGREALALYRMSSSLKGKIHLDIGICLESLGRDNEAKAERRLAANCLDTPPVDALGWLVQGRLFAAGLRYAEAIDAYERVLRMPFFESKTVQRDASFQLTLACVKAGRLHDAIRWAEQLLEHEATRSGRYFLHQIAGKACSILGRLDDERRHKRRAYELAMEAKETGCIVDSVAALEELERL